MKRQSRDCLGFCDLPVGVPFRSRTAYARGKDKVGAASPALLCPTLIHPAPY
jgi:hypothetical protein